MTVKNRWVWGLAAVAITAVCFVAAAARPLNGEKGPPSLEGEFREMKRRLDKLEGERAALYKRADGAKQVRKELLGALEKANKRIDAVKKQGALDAVALGAMIPCFGKGDTPPKGYVFADGSSSWPKAAWVPVHLAEAKVPNIREHLVGGAKEEGAVGRTFNQGQLVLGSRTIPGNAFQLPLPARRTISEAANTKGGIGLVRIAKRNNAGGWGAWTGGGASFGFQTGCYRGYAGNEQLNGSHQLPQVALKPNSASSNPRHVMCRWIIRVG